VSTREDEKDESVSDDEDKLCETENNSYRRLDELDLYLALKIDKDRLPTNPLEFWHENQRTYPILLKVARKIHSIPATTAERQFSSARLVVQKRRSSTNPEQVDNVLLIQIRNCHKYVQQQMGLSQVDVDIPKSEPKKKTRKRFGQEFEDDESSSNDGSEVEMHRLRL
ncbi:unnamed protein product, partial [Didymodactylos carnosus]